MILMTTICTLALQAIPLGEQRDALRVEAARNFWAAPDCAMPPLDMARWKVYQARAGAAPELLGQCAPPDATTPACPSFVNVGTQRGSQYMIEMQIPLQDGATAFLQLPVAADSLLPDPCKMP